MNLIQTDLFSSINPNEIPRLLECMRAKYVDFRKDEFIIEEGRATAAFGIVISGRARSIKWDASGRLVIITLIDKGGEVGVMLAAGGRPSPVAVQAIEDTTVMMIAFDRVVARCSNNCQWHEQLLKNYIGVVAKKGVELYERINCLLEPTVRDKIHTYLSRISYEQGSRVFTVPFNRNIMAEYLNIERSALSRELSRMKKDGLIDYHKNRFKLH